MAYYGITSRADLIDIATISTGCSQLEVAAEKFVKCAELVDSAASICDSSALSVEKTTMQPQLQADAEFIRSLQNVVSSFATAIRSASSQVYAAQEAELAAYLEEQRKLAEQQSANTN